MQTKYEKSQYLKASLEKNLWHLNVYNGFLNSFGIIPHAMQALFRNAINGQISEVDE